MNFLDSKKVITHKFLKVYFCTLKKLRFTKPYFFSSKSQKKIKKKIETKIPHIFYFVSKQILLFTWNHPSATKISDTVYV